MSGIVRRIGYIIGVFFLSPTLFFKKIYMRILFKVFPVPKGDVSKKVGGYTIVTRPSRNDWWKSMYLGVCGAEIVQSIK